MIFYYYHSSHRCCPGTSAAVKIHRIRKIVTSNTFQNCKLARCFTVKMASKCQRIRSFTVDAIFAFFIFVSRENSFSTCSDIHGLSCSGCTGWMHRHSSHNTFFHWNSNRFFLNGVFNGPSAFESQHMQITLYDSCKMEWEKSPVRTNWSMELQFERNSSAFASCEIVRASNRHTKIRNLPSSSALLLLWPLSVLTCFICGYYHK